MDGIQLHHPNTGINKHFTSVGENSSFEYLSHEETWIDTVGRCISDTFVVSINKEIVFSLTLTTNCDFFLTDYQSNERIYGRYIIFDEIIKGSMSTIVFFIDGESIGEAVLAWPLEDDLCLIINGVVFRKKNKN